MGGDDEAAEEGGRRVSMMEVDADAAKDNGDGDGNDRARRGTIDGDEHQDCDEGVCGTRVGGGWVRGEGSSSDEEKAEDAGWEGTHDN